MLTFNCIAEVPVFFYSGAIIQRLGVEATMQLSLVAYALRFTAYLVCVCVVWWQCCVLWLLLSIQTQLNTTKHSFYHTYQPYGCCCQWRCSRVSHWGARGLLGLCIVGEWHPLGWAQPPRAYLLGRVGNAGCFTFVVCMGVLVHAFLSIHAPPDPYTTPCTAYMQG